MCCNSKCGGKGSCCIFSTISKVFLIVGGLNWGLVGAGILAGSYMEWNLVTLLFGSWPVVEAIVYLLVGVSAIVHIFGCPCKQCKMACGECSVEGMHSKTEGSMENKM
jgi:uncharacterized membrane protein YuzA (DUF378 family)